MEVVFIHSCEDDSFTMIYYVKPQKDRINFMLILSLGFTGLILSFSIDEYFSINRHTVFFITSIIIHKIYLKF